MRISRIYTPVPLGTQQRLALDDKASHHLSRVLRLKIGDPLTLFNGDGLQYAATIAALDKKSVSVETAGAEAINNESPLHTHLGIAVSKGDRMDWVMQKATELGVTAITPLLSERTELRLNPERREKKHQHWQQILISACEQCGRNTLPQLNPLQKLEDWLGSVEGDKKLVLHHRANKTLNPTDQVSSAVLLIGPEGGLSEAEIQFAQRQQFEALCMGPRILRTETAPLVSLAILQQLWGDFQVSTD